MDTPITLQQISEQIRQAVHIDVEFIYIYGSFARGQTHAESDLDIGIYYNKFDTEHESKVRQKINNLFDLDVDIVDMKKADPIIVMQILANGKLIIQNNVNLHSQFFAYRVSEYVDLKFSRKIIEDKLLQGNKRA